jgi:hypothetical protein
MSREFLYFSSEHIGLFSIKRMFTVFSFLGVFRTILYGMLRNLLNLGEFNLMERESELRSILFKLTSPREPSKVQYLSFSPTP